MEQQKFVEMDSSEHLNVVALSETIASGSGNP